MSILDSIKNIYNKVTGNSSSTTTTPTKTISVGVADSSLGQGNVTASDVLKAVDAAGKTTDVSSSSSGTFTAPTYTVGHSSNQTSNQIVDDNPYGNSTTSSPNITTDLNNMIPQSNGSYKGLSQDTQQALSQISSPVTIKQPSYISQNGEYQYDFFSLEGQKERFANLLDVMKIALNPFSDDRINANVENNILKKGLEAVANNPYTTAAYATAIGQVAKAVSVAAAAGESLAAGNVLVGETAASAGGLKAVMTAAGTAVNTVTTKAKVAILQGITAGLKNPKVALGVLGTYAFSTNMAMNEKGDAIQALGIAITSATKAGDIKGAEEMKDMLDDITNPTLINTLKIYAPIINYPIAAITKLEAARLQSDIAMDEMRQAQIEQAANDALLAKINAGLATDAEIAAYAEANPYSAIATIYKNKLVSEAEKKAADYPYGTLDEYGNYIPSAYEIAKRKEQQDYYNSLNNTNYNTTSNTEQTYQPPSSLNFGLLRTSGGYELATKDGSGNQEFVTDTNTIADYYFGVPYSQLTEAQKQLVDMMVG